MCSRVGCMAGSTTPAPSLLLGATAAPPASNERTERLPRSPNQRVKMNERQQHQASQERRTGGRRRKRSSASRAGSKPPVDQSTANQPAGGEQRRSPRRARKHSPAGHNTVAPVKEETRARNPEGRPGQQPRTGEARQGQPRTGGSRQERVRAREQNARPHAAPVAITPRGDTPVARRARKEEVVGTLRTHPRGFGFLERPGLPSIFVPPTKLRGLIDAAIVSAIVRSGTDEAERTRLVERVRTEAVGEITSRGTVKLDPGIGNLEVALTGEKPAEGSTVVVALLPGERASVVDILGDELSSDALVRRMLVRHRLPHLHTDAAVQEADRIAGRGADAARLPRRDLTDQLVVTIDADHSEDLDDALAAAPGPDGSLRVWVHIADVSEHVRPGTVIDREAAATPTSIYLPTFTRHMLPPRLGASRLSLLPGVERDTLTVEMRVDAAGVVSSVDVYESKIRSARRLSYVTVAKLLNGERPDQVDVADAEAQLVRYLWAAAVRLGHQRDARGGVDAWRGDRDPQIPAGEDNAHLLVERLMVATNEAVASWLEQRGMPVLARAHAAPNDEAVAEIEQAANSIGLWASLPRPITPAAFAALAAQAEGNRYARVFWESVMGSMERALYTTKAGGHFGLGSERYLHFTSPLRRYADLLVHRVVKSYLAGHRDLTAAPLENAASVINDVTRRADLAERQTRRAEALKLLKPRQQVRCAVIGTPKNGSVRVVVEDLDLVTNVPYTGTPPAVGSSLKARVRSVDVIADRLDLTQLD